MIRIIKKNPENIIISIFSKKNFYGFPSIEKFHESNFSEKMKIITFFEFS